MQRFRIGFQGFLPVSVSLACLGLLLVIGATAAPVRAQGEEQFRAGQRAEEQRNYDEAFEQYQSALQADSNNVQYMMSFRRMRFQAGAMHVDRGNELRQQGDLAGALAEYERAAMIDPSSPVAFQSIEQVRALIEQQQAGQSPADQDPMGTVLQEALGPPELEPLSREPINLRMANESRVIYETLGRLAGVNVLFDPDFMSRRITVDLANVTLEEALDQVSVLTRSFWKPLSRNTILVLPDTTVKRREQEQQILKTFYLSNTITPQELTEVVTAIRSLLETRRIQQVNSMNAIIIRDTPDKVAIAEKIIRDVDKAKPEVVVDVAVLEVRRDRAQQVGLFPTSSGGPGIQTTVAPTVGTTTSTGGTGTTTTTSTGSSIRLNRLGSLSTADFSITLPGAQLNALLNDGNTKILQRPEIRASDNQRATLRIGDRRPIATGSFQPGVGGTVVSPLVQTQFQYIDVGVNLDITPKVHTNEEITLAVRIEISAVTGEVNIGGITQPIIGQRIIEHNIRLREGEINVLGGIFQRQNVESVTGVPGLSQIPLLRYIFSNVSTNLAEDEVLIVLRPHAVRRPDITSLNRKALDIGTEGDVRLRSPRATPEEPEAAPEGEPAPAAPATPEAAPGAALRLPGATPSPRTGEAFEIPIGIENAADAFSVSLQVAYDPRALRLVRVAKGNFLGSDGQPVAVVERTEEDSGTTTVTLSRPPGSGSISGNGELAVLTFEARQTGPTALGILPTGMLTSSRRDVSLQGTQAVLTIQ
jgi:general secretion pathway protein D